MNDEWLIYRGVGEPHDGIEALPGPPPWRDFDGGPVGEAGGVEDGDVARRLGAHRQAAEMHRPEPEELDAVNAALYLRRPLLVTGYPGTGKSTLAHAVAHELKLGRVLRWPVVSRTVLQEGLYRYDAIARLQDVQIAAGGGVVGGAGGGAGGGAPGIGKYIRLGPLGTALLPTARPRVLLIDELDKSDIDLPNDLLNVLEEGEFVLPELERVADTEPEVQVLTDDGAKVTVRDGRVRCRAFPFIVLTSNGERDFPAALLRRCIQLKLGQPGEKRLATMVRAHLGEEAAQLGADLIRQFLSRSRSELVAADQLLNAIYLTHYAAPPTREDLADLLIQRLDRPR
ncbi:MULTISPECIES: MoxR family ATPase [unclassified Streptomyces]|uniref:AAA family ATPase n=1 Tax=unclassified Streptomyces TaxID=2593676 RepID=UPI001BE61F1B|nr:MULTISPECIES: MoxR family ATPase [unclassified Streptomyces]MBT2406765.1 AAA family ATPase [Streptomyces sp. ISL-21]MBT2453826.1 AAA family ATPase [Streptomyces sp. ISL-86]MBT2608959.1 AAA family ATPase [Streptomyces sp. ISL-87]